MAKPKNPPKAREYAVGRGKPPLHTQWPKGVSGNPGGKKKTSIDLPRIFDAASQRPIIVKLDGEKREISSLEAVVMRLFEIGLKGDMRAITTILDRSSLLLKASGGDQNVETSEEDLAILQRVLADQEPKPSRKRRRKAASVEDEGAQLRGGKPEGEDD